MKEELKKISRFLALFESNKYEPAIDEITMQIHQEKHHMTYFDKLQIALAEEKEEFKDLEEILINLESISEKNRILVRNNAGGVLNHNLFFYLLNPNYTHSEGNLLVDQIKSTFGSFEDFHSTILNTGMSLFGSGWVWLVKSQEGRLEIINTANQDNPIIFGKRPVMGIDLWEHAYYLKYQNRRKDYLESILKIIDWKKAEEIFLEN